ncbi:hypothetical protein AB894_15215 [Piscirickettsia salmonis]|nr:hypothetical protein AB894_15215 [Piscirickettsia salmonis]
MNPFRLLQANINHCAAAQDLLLQSMAQWSINVAVVSEPYFVPPRDHWVADLDGSVTIISSAAAGTPTLESAQRGRGCVAARFGEIAVVGVYFSPNRTLVEFHNSLRELVDVVVGFRSLPVLVLGDFNAKNLAWGSRLTDVRGRMVEDWALETGLVVLNRGSVPTCVRMQGESVVDISFASPALSPRVVDWRVMEEVETFSDHRYIRFNVSAESADPPVRQAPCGPRWALRQLDRELFLEAAIVQAWVIPPDRPADIDEEARWLQDAMSRICDVAMPRVRPGQRKRQVYWWSQELAALRSACVTARRQYTRHRRLRIRPPEAEIREAELYEGYKVAKAALKAEIWRAKEEARREMLETLNRDPWGRPYRMVRDKLRTWAPPLTQSLRPEIVEEVVGALFPRLWRGFTPPSMTPPPAVPNVGHSDDDDDIVPEVTEAEMRAAVRRMGAKNTAPGPDGLHGKAWVLASEALGPRLLGLYSACLERGQFPLQWKTGKLVLVKKPGRPADSPSAYRPIVLLDEVGKVFERIISNRLVAHLSGFGPDLADGQFGFRRGRSTVDAIMRVRDLTTGNAVSRGKVVVAVSLDIANAFNSLPWSCILEALRYHRVPTYLRRVIEAYLTDRFVTYAGHQGEWNRREMSRGVPQGSVLGPLLWNIGYDWVLRTDLPNGVSVVCYADDTLVLAHGRSHQAAANLMARAVATVVARIRQLGLEVALHKSEAMCFHGRGNAPPPDGSQITAGGVTIGVETTMKYLGLVLDSRWNFVEHFRRLAPKLERTGAALKRLLPNLGGPNASCRRLYAGVVRSMALYGAPVWAPNLMRRPARALLTSQRVMAIRVIRGYRTISGEAANLLAGLPPWDLEAKVLARVFSLRADARRRGETPLPRQISAWRDELRRDLMAEWQQRLSQPRAGLAVIAAVSPLFEEWLERRHGVLTYRLTQVLTGHGSFGRFLFLIGREETPGCHHCEDRPEDTVEHTLAVCPAWAEHRRVLRDVVGDGALSRPALIQAMVRSEGDWDAVSSFCEAVMLAKEEAGRVRERTSSRPSRRERHSGRRGSRDDLRPP